MYTAKQRMLNAYKGIFSDHIPCAPEFWYFYPAKVLGVSMIEYQREIPHWVGMYEAFKKFGCEGWGIAGPTQSNPNIVIKSEFKKIDTDKYRDEQRLICDGKEFTRSYIYSDKQPLWSEKNPVNDNENAKVFFNSLINDDIRFDLKDAIKAHEKVGEVFLLEFDLGVSFFDCFEGFMGFENALLYFLDEDESVLNEMREIYTKHKLRLVNEVAEKTPYEVCFIGCSSSCNSLLGPVLWRKWDKPYEKAMTDECHRLGLLIHNHNHGPIMETVHDLVDIGFDCVCPFERPPGDVAGLEGLKKVRKLLDDKVTFNGNIHTVRALIQGTPDDVRAQVKEVKEAFAGSARVIVGTGDQVGYETPEENLWAMLEETRRK